MSANIWRSATRPTFDDVILLDTHVVLWHFSDPQRWLSADTVELINRCGRNESAFASDISVWEIGNKIAKHQLALPFTLSAWIAAVEEAPGFRFLPVDRETFAASTALTDAHGDPADRILIATAIQHDMPLVTADTKIIEYAHTHHGLTVIDARF